MTFSSTLSGILMTKVKEHRILSKIGRNEPCPCGSGKKYKKCCIDRPYPVMRHWSYEEVNEMDTEDIIQMLENIGIPFDEDTFLEDVEKHDLAQDISEGWFDDFEVTAQGRDEDFPWFAAWVLWERMAPADNVSVEQMSNSIYEGEQYFLADDPETGCDIWLEVWKAIKAKCQQQACSDLDLLDEQFRGAFFVSNFVQDLEMELRNAGVRDKSYFKKRIDYCREFLTVFSDANDSILANMRRSIAESYACLGDYEQADLEFEGIVQERPHDPWGYIAWGDTYASKWPEGEIDYDRARDFYMKALAIADDRGDIVAVQESLEETGVRRTKGGS